MSNNITIGIIITDMQWYLYLRVGGSRFVKPSSSHIFTLLFINQNIISLVYNLLLVISQLPVVLGQKFGAFSNSPVYRDYKIIHRHFLG